MTTIKTSPLSITQTHLHISAGASSDSCRLCLLYREIWSTCNYCRRWRARQSPGTEQWRHDAAGYDVITTVYKRPPTVSHAHYTSFQRPSCQPITQDLWKTHRTKPNNN